jgi:hypothetical protein
VVILDATLARLVVMGRRPPENVAISCTAEPTALAVATSAPVLASLTVVFVTVWLTLVVATEPDTEAPLVLTAHTSPDAWCAVTGVYEPPSIAELPALSVDALLVVLDCELFVVPVLDDDDVLDEVLEVNAVSAACAVATACCADCKACAVTICAPVELFSP